MIGNTQICVGLGRACQHQDVVFNMRRSQPGNMKTRSLYDQMRNLGQHRGQAHLKDPGPNDCLMAWRYLMQLRLGALTLAEVYGNCLYGVSSWPSVASGVAGRRAFANDDCTFEPSHD